MGNNQTCINKEDISNIITICYDFCIKTKEEICSLFNLCCDACNVEDCQFCGMDRKDHINGKCKNDDFSSKIYERSKCMPRNLSERLIDFDMSDLTLSEKSSNSLDNNINTNGNLNKVNNKIALSENTNQNENKDIINKPILNISNDSTVNKDTEIHIINNVNEDKITVISTINQSSADENNTDNSNTNKNIVDSMPHCVFEQNLSKTESVKNNNEDISNIEIDTDSNWSELNEEVINKIEI